MSRTFHYAGVMAVGILLLPPAFAEDGISGEVGFEIWTDAVISADAEESEITNTYAIIEPAFSMALTPQLSLNTGFVFEQVEDPEDDSLFEDHGFYVSDLFFEWSGEALSLHAGKLGAAFGVAWDVAPGLYGVDFAEDYEIAEQWAAGAVIPFGGDEEGSLSLSIDAFMADTTGLSSSAGTRRERLRRADGGPGNTSVPKSFSITLGADSLAGGPGFQVGILHRDAGDESDPGNKDELGFALALVHAIELDGDSGIEWMAEGAWLNDFEGAPDADVTFFTAGLTYLNGPWNVAVAGAMRKTDTGEGPETDDTLFQLSAGYAFDSGLSVDVGWRHGDEGDESSQTIGAVIAYGIEF